MRSNAFLTDENVDVNIVAVYLNSPRLLDAVSNLSDVANRASRHVFADGAADYASELLEHAQTSTFTIIGDLDSVSESILSRRDVVVVKDDDQHSTDCTKALRHVLDDAPDNTVVMVFGVTGGRFDSQISNLNSMFLQNTNVRILCVFCSFVAAARARAFDSQSTGELVKIH